MGDVSGTKTIKSALSKARSALRSKNPKPEKARESFDKAIKALEEDIVWRQRAATELLSGLEAYEASIRDTIGLRLQPRLPEKQALEIAACNADHRDISLSF